jgi:hypothetical protein
VRACAAPFCHWLLALGAPASSLNIPTLAAAETPDMPCERYPNPNPNLNLNPNLDLLLQLSKNRYRTGIFLRRPDAN